MPESKPVPLTATLGLVLCRVIVPLWVLMGAVFKLKEGNPGLLPRGILLDATRLHINLDFLLAVLVSLEFCAAFAMIFLPRVARAAAIFMLTGFCLVLVREIVAGRTSCGCLGAYSFSPIVMIVIDGTLLAGVLAFKPRRWRSAPVGRWPVAAAIILAGAATGTTFGWLLPEQVTPPLPPVSPPEPRISGDGGHPDAAAPDPDPAAARPLPSTWFETNVGTWVGRRWSDVDLFQYLGTAPRDVDGPEHYVVFYSRTCDHCETMFNLDFAPSPGLARKVTAVEIPVGKDELTGNRPWPIPETECELLSLPLGVNWIITPPLAVRIENGVITCAEEGEEYRRCLDLE